ncbi:hypothetical protein SERLA73DRAFT_68759 [Serpula lacrymans var. lacrymans S7.3]|uniref:Uncharacterized protein n=2 Tax=Serpula lacrymans var. lacrymans TaxID=341189 RepID=F8PI79_SERL3|nr:uncharacterized protein SERLADRAFT_432527 [Serpula lacrymans var. lacrymans S7.9]EGO05122.1 hypothetical protein SERLA73DRAFT_68759 [Serpula lacrymans var. lacrymans S7.3]EGO30877.1 hypothetical protein SERLADRAFT_432527 [Serpula lacrymans var. lacrymans S7.9]
MPRCRKQRSQAQAAHLDRARELRWLRLDSNKKNNIISFYNALSQAGVQTRRAAHSHAIKDLEVKLSKANCNFDLARKALTQRNSCIRRQNAELASKKALLAARSAEAMEMKSTLQALERSASAAVEDLYDAHLRVQRLHVLL